jgi:hypothetical protein
MRAQPNAAQESNPALAPTPISIRGSRTRLCRPSTWTHVRGMTNLFGIRRKKSKKRVTGPRKAIT